MLRDIDLAIPRGQTLAVIGESGCGKTVLLKTIIGLMRPTSGDVLFDGTEPRRAQRQGADRTQRTRFGFVFQNAALFDSMTVAENVAFPLREQHRGQRATKSSEIVSRGWPRSGLPESVLAKKPAELSGGMRKRVGLARALAMIPRCCSTTSRRPASTRS